MDLLKNIKVGTWLGIGVIGIIVVMVLAMAYSNYLSGSAKEIITENTQRTFHVLEVQGDSERFFSSLDETIVIITEPELDAAQERSFGLLNRLNTTVDENKERVVFDGEEIERLEEILADTKSLALGYFKLKRELIQSGADRGRTFEGGYSVESKDLSQWFDKLSNNKYEVLGIMSQVIMRSDRASQEALTLVKRAQTISWVVVGVSLLLASLMGLFLVRSTKKIFDLKNEFINIIAHDLRNPVTAILGYIDIIMTKEDTTLAEVKKQLKIVEVATHRLRSQINNLLEVGRSEAGHIKINMEPVKIAEVLDSSVLRAKAFADTQGISVMYKDKESKDIMVMADKHKLADVFDNLISNAIKYNKKKGSVTISTKDEGNIFAVLVTDTGYGIPEDQQDKLFKKYSRLEGSSKERVGGTGLGLYTVKLDLDQMDGEVSYTTNKNIGTTFRVVLNKNQQNNQLI